MKPTLTLADFERGAKALGTGVREVKTVAKVEAPYGGFQASGEPTILFERHVFSKRTGGRFDKTDPDLSNPVAGGYGLYSAQHGRLQRAAALDRTAALESTSWGMFQTMGFNHAACGFPTLQGFVNAMYESEGRHLDAFVGYVLTNGLEAALREHRWADFARGYNGSGYRVNKYDEKLAAAYKDFA